MKIGIYYRGWPMDLTWCILKELGKQNPPDRYIILCVICSYSSHKDTVWFKEILV